jgi:hypothetical protein
MNEIKINEEAPTGKVVIDAEIFLFVLERERKKGKEQGFQEGFIRGKNVAERNHADFFNELLHTIAMNQKKSE